MGHLLTATSQRSRDALRRKLIKWDFGLSQTHDWQTKPSREIENETLTINPRPANAGPKHLKSKPKEGAAMDTNPKCQLRDVSNCEEAPELDLRDGPFPAASQSWGGPWSMSWIPDENATFPYSGTTMREPLQGQHEPQPAIPGDRMLVYEASGGTVVGSQLQEINQGCLGYMEYPRGPAFNPAVVYQRLDHIPMHAQENFPSEESQWTVSDF